MRTFTREERAEMEEARRAEAAHLSRYAWEELKRMNKLAHGDLTARFLASREAKTDGGRDPAHTDRVSGRGVV